VMAVDGQVGRRPFDHLDQTRPDAKPVFLLAGDLTGVTTHTVLLKDHQRDFVHLFFPLWILAGRDVAQEHSQVRRAHDWVTDGEVIVGQDVHVGDIPAMAGTF